MTFLTQAISFQMVGNTVLYALAAGSIATFLKTLDQVILGRTQFGRDVTKELQSGPAFRPVTDPRMFYVAFGSPFVSALFLAVFFHAFKESIPLNHSDMVDNMLTAACAASVLWLATTFHGVLLDYSCFQVSWKITVYFLATSLLHAAVFGAVYAQCFAKGGFFHGPCCAKAAAAAAAAAEAAASGAAAMH